jgi:ATP-dependent helicase/nuclease subunit B
MLKAKNLSKTLFVFQTSRKLQKFFAENQNKLLHAMSLTDFFDRVELVNGKSKISKSAQIALLRRVAQTVDIGKLGFQGGFLEFLSNSDFLFSFFEELRGEQKNINDIRGEDLYAAFEDHLGVLEELFFAYKEELSRLGYYDFISVDEWGVNADYLKNFDEIYIDSMGLFTAHELSFLDKVSQEIKTTLSFTIDKYNKKMAKKFATIDIDIGDSEGRLLIDISSKKLIKAEINSSQRSQISSYRLKNRIYEAPFAMSKIAEFIEAGCDPENIAIILPDESFAQLLTLFDKQNNLNFAFGEPLSKGVLFNKLDALLKYAAGEKNDYKLAALGVAEIKNGFSTLSSTSGFLPLKKAVLALLELSDDGRKVKNEKKLFKEELYKLECESIIFEYLNSVEVGHVLLSALKAKKIDDNSGGRIKVIGVLESRGIELDAAIILDMNDDFFPKRLDKDLFLNTKIKEKAGIPTTEDRQNLQKHFFLELMNNTKECVFAFVENDEQSPSPFLFELGLLPVDVDEESLEKLYFSQTKREKAEPIEYDDLKSFYDQYKESRQKAELSVSAFCDYLKCEKLFYFRHIKKIYSDTIQDEEELNILLGNAIHKALEKAYEPKSGHYFADENQLAEFVKKEALEYAPQLKDRFEFAYTMRQMDSFFANEIARQKSGFGVYAVEKEIKADISGVSFNARVDRIDKKGDEFFIIDYKVVSKEIKADSAKAAEDSSKYQLCLYMVMLQKEGIDAKEAYYYDILRGKLVSEDAMPVKLHALEGHIARFRAKPSFTGAKDKAACRYCDFALICGTHSDAVWEDADE